MVKVTTHYVVVFDNSATHRCESYEEAVAFAEKPDDEFGIFAGAKPIRVDKVTRTVTVDVETARSFDG